jgi:hypothetical protein
VNVSGELFVVLKEKAVRRVRIDRDPRVRDTQMNTWAALKGYLDEVTAVAAAPVIEKYTGVLAAADLYTESTTFWVMESIRLDLGYGSQVHP